MTKEELTPDQQKAVEAEIRRVAAEIIVPLFDNPDEIKSWDKAGGEHDAVTFADLKGEEALIAFLQKLIPGCTIIGEEGIGTDGANLERLKKSKGIVFTIDPVDGTANFRKKDPHFGTMVACVIDGIAQHAWILCPKLDNGTMLTATRGEGAFIEQGAHGKKRLQPHMTPLRELTFGHYALEREHLSYLQDKNAAIGASLVEHIKGFSKHSCMAAETLAMVTEGKTSIFYLAPKTWDCVPPALILQEMGGYAAPINDPDVEMFGYSGDVLVLFAPYKKNGEELNRAMASSPHANLINDARIRP